MNYVFPDLSSASPPRGRFEALSAEKLRGGYYTPTAVAEWICKWALRSKSDSVLEPSCGAGAFVATAALRLADMKATKAAIAKQIVGVELFEAEAEAARKRLTPIVGDRSAAVITAGDFFEWCSVSGGRRFSAVVGNPPFIRYQSFPEPARSAAMAMMENLGFRPNRLTNIWVPFVVGAAEKLLPGGRLAMVIPAELLQVTYAAQLRSYLTERFKHIDVVACNELFFPGAEQEVVILLADDALRVRTPGLVCRVAVSEVATVTEVVDSEPVDLLLKAEDKDVRGETEKWLKYFLTKPEIGLLRALRSTAAIVNLGTLADVDVGIVTGANEFFVLRGAEMRRRGLDDSVHRLVSRSAHMRGAVISGCDWSNLDARDERVHLVNIRLGASGRLPRRSAAYVADGEARDVHVGYKCSIRRPWYHVPALWNPDAFLFRQIHDFPRIVLNRAQASSTDTIHRVRARHVSPEVLVAGLYTHLTAASAEIEGRSYGGGVLELEPTEAERLLVPNAEAMAAALPLEECDAMIRAGRLNDVLEANDKRVLRSALGLTAKDCKLLRSAWGRMQGRRFARGSAKRRANPYSSAL